MRKSALLAAVAATLAALFTMPIAAQPNSAPPPQLIDEIVITGYKASLGAAIDRKRNASSILDSINAEDIGKFPDQNVAESLSRISGVTVTRDFGEGEKVSIRGTQTNQNRTLLNGVSVASTDWFTLDLPSRGFNYLILPSNLIRSAEVYKSPQANIQEGSLGGTVVLNTRKPLDFEDPDSGLPFTFSGQLEYQDSDNSGENDPQVSTLFSWKNGDDTVGALLSFTRQERSLNRFGREVVTFLAPDNGDNETDAWFPRLIGETDFRQERVRETIFGSFQWAPTDNFEATLNILDTNLDANNINQNNLITAGPDGTKPVEPLANNVTYEGSGDERGVVAATLDASDPVPATPNDAGEYGNRSNSGGRTQAFDRISSIETQSYDLEAVWKNGGNELTVRIGMTDSEGGAPDERYWGFTTEGKVGERGPKTAADPRIDRVGAIDRITFDRNLNLQFLTRNDANGNGTLEDDETELVPESPEQYLARPFEFANARSTVNEEEESYLGIDYAMDTDLGAFQTVTVGFLYRDREKGRTASITEYHRWTDAQHTDDAAGYGTVKDGETNWSQSLAGGTLGQYTAGERGADYELIDSATARRLASPDLATPPVPVLTRPNLTDTWTVEEEIFAAYIKAEFSEGNISGDIGLRAVSTDLSSTGWVASASSETPGWVEAANGASASMVGAHFLATAFGCHNYDETLNGAASAMASATKHCQATLTTVDNSYTEILPSLNVSFDMSDNTKLRFAAARTMSRPDPQSLALRENFFVNTASGTRGNPNLKPITANQYDLSWERYLTADALLAITYFYKDITGNLIPGQVQETRTDPDTGNRLEVTFNTPENAQDATLDGIELLYQQPLGNNFGVVLNFTWTDSETDEERDIYGRPGSGVVTGVSDEVYNLTGYYEDDRLDVRVSYNWRSEYLNEVAYFGSEIWTDAYGQLDISASYDITDNFELTFDALNVTDEDIDQYHLITSRPSKIYDNDQRFLVGLNFSF
ncbi:MAG: TonB-dependent receptor [Cellvibrionales bacterium]|nr:TonB-dependent receptor [Cellvibrionales bacterium]